MYTLPQIKQIGSGSLMYAAGNPKPAHSDNPEGWGGEGGSGWRRHMYADDPFILMDGKNHQNTLK